MKSISSNLAAALASEAMPMASCLFVQLSNGTDLAFTSADQDIIVDGVTYQAANGIDATDVASTATLEVDNLELAGMMVSPAITEADLRAGIWDNASMRLLVVHAEHPEYGALIQRVGHIGRVTVEGGKFTAEFRGLTQAYSTSIVEKVSASCRARLGDARCGFNLPSRAVTGTVGTIDTDNVTIHDASRTEPPHPSGSAYFIGGVVTFTSGLNNGLSREIREATTGVLQIAIPMPYAVAAGDTYSATPGCPKLRVDCIGTFNNIVNFRGEPDAPGNDLMIQQGRDE